MAKMIIPPYDAIKALALRGVQLFWQLEEMTGLTAKIVAQYVGDVWYITENPSYTERQLSEEFVRVVEQALNELVDEGELRSIVERTADGTYTQYEIDTYRNARSASPPIPDAEEESDDGDDIYDPPPSLSESSVLVQSFTDPLIRYEVNFKNGTCTCPDFVHRRSKEGGPCKHMDAISTCITTHGTAPGCMRMSQEEQEAAINALKNERAAPTYTSYRVKSDSGNGSYIVDCCKGTCTCPDFIYRHKEQGGPCKHMDYVSDRLYSINALTPEFAVALRNKVYPKRAPEPESEPEHEEPETSAAAAARAEQVVYPTFTPTTTHPPDHIMTVKGALADQEWKVNLTKGTCSCPGFGARFSKTHKTCPHMDEIVQDYMIGKINLTITELASICPRVRNIRVSVDEVDHDIDVFHEFCSTCDNTDCVQIPYAERVWSELQNLGSL